MNHPNLSAGINAALASPGANEEGTFFLSGHITVNTSNSVYEMKYEGDQCFIRGGTRWPEWTPCDFWGSNFGGSMLKVKWIGVGMHMEVFAEGRAVRMSQTKGWSLRS